MADSENTPPDGEGKDAAEELKHFRIEARRVVAELIVMLESLKKLPEAVLLQTQLETLRGLVMRAVETVEGFNELISGTASS